MHILAHFKTLHVECKFSFGPPNLCNSFANDIGNLESLWFDRRVQVKKKRTHFRLREMRKNVLQDSNKCSMCRQCLALFVE